MKRAAVIARVALCFGCATALPVTPPPVATPEPFGPAGWSAPSPAQSPRFAGEANPGYWWFRVWSATWSQVDGPQCMHAPTCSLYGWRAVRTHGPLVGAWMTVDRVWRDDLSSAVRRLPMAFAPGGARFVDPVPDAAPSRGPDPTPTAGGARP